MSSPFYKPEKVYYLECGDKCWTFQHATLLNYHESKLSKVLGNSGMGKSNSVHLDYDPQVMDIIIREMKNPGCVDWRECSRTNLNLANKYTHELRLYEIAEQIDVVLKLKRQIKKLSVSTIENLLGEAKKAIKLPTEAFTTLANLIFNTRVWYFEDIEPEGSSRSASPGRRRRSRSKSRSRSRSKSKSRSRSGSRKGEEKDGESKRPIEEEKKSLPTISLASLMSAPTASPAAGPTAGPVGELKMPEEKPVGGKGKKKKGK